MTRPKKRRGHSSTKSSGKRRGPVTARKKWLGSGIAVATIASITLVGIYFTRPNIPAFDADRALSDVHTLVDLGPRVPASPAHEAGLEFLRTRLEPLADQLTTQALSVEIAGGDTLRGTNLIASFNLQPKRNVRVMLGAHWDSRPHADRDSDTLNIRKPVPGANDGASGVAVLLEMARLLHLEAPEVGVDLLLFDLEDSGVDSLVPFAAGSEQFAAENAHYRPTFGIIVDMVCDHNLRLPREANSMQAAKHIVDLVWDAAEDEDASAFLDELGGSVTDDHIAFLRRGIPVIDIIQLPFPEYWHTTRDTPDKCSAESLDQVGRVLTRVVYTQ